MRVFWNEWRIGWFAYMWGEECERLLMIGPFRWSFKAKWHERS